MRRSIERLLTVLPEPLSPHDADGLALPQGIRDAVDGVYGRLARLEMHAEALDFQ